MQMRTKPRDSWTAVMYHKDNVELDQDQIWPGSLTGCDQLKRKQDDSTQFHVGASEHWSSQIYGKIPYHNLTRSFSQESKLHWRCLKLLPLIFAGGWRQKLMSQSCDQVSWMLEGWTWNWHPCFRSNYRKCFLSCNRWCFPSITCSRQRLHAQGSHEMMC